MPEPNSRLRPWLRTTDGRLAILIAVLAVIAIVAFVIRSYTESPPPSPTQFGAQPQNLQTRMINDLRSGMRHGPFLQKYGKPTRVERRPDGLLRLYYDLVTVTFDESGKPIESIINLKQ